MGSLLALLSLGLLLLTTLITDGSSRYFKVSPKEGTAPLQVTFTANELYGSKQAEKFIWTMGNGETITTATPTVVYTYNNAGIFTAKLKYLKKNTDTVSKAKDGGSVKIEVKERPNLLPTPLLLCVSNSINNLECNANGTTDSDGSIVSYNYDWGDGSNNLMANPDSVTHSYTQAGEKTVRLTVTDNKGGSASVEKSFLLKANTAPVANFSCAKTGIQKIHCESTSTDSEENISNFAWTLDDGAVYNTASFDHRYSRPQDVAIASHNVSLKVTDTLGLESTLAKDVEVDLEAIREAPRGYFKAFIDETTIDLRAFIAKTQFSTKKATYQIFDSQNNLIHTLPISGFYQNHSTKINLENFGNYRVTLTIVDYRDQQIVITRQVPLVEDTSTLAPFVAFRAIQSNIRTLYLNLNQSFDYDENYSIREFVVSLGNGQTRTLTTDTFLTYTYPEAGTYMISVTAKTNHGTEKTFSQPVTITDNDVAPVMPDPTFSYRIYSFAQNVSFYNEKSGTPNGEIISYLWDFGDGTTASGETQAHFYMPGDYLVTLTVVDTAGYSSTQTQKISILAEGDDIVANIDCTQRQPYLDITQMCKVNALDKFNEINRIRVVWGDGTVFTLATPFDPRQGVYYPQKAYTAEGTYAIRLIVNTARGAFKTHDISHKVTARKPVANIQCDVNNLLVNCHALGSFDPKGTPLLYEFNLGNGHSESSNTGMITYAYSDAGLYDVSVKVTDAQGLFSIATTKVQAVRPPNILPVADFNCDSPNPLTIYCWDNGSHDPDGSIVIRKLSFDDGSSDFLNTTNSTRHQFTSSGEHFVTLTVIDNDGGVKIVSKTILVKKNNPPVASFECNTYGPQKMNCYSTSVDPDNGDMVSSFDWDLGDGTIQIGFSGAFDHVYGANSVYTVKLTVHDQYGESSTIQKDITMIKNQAPVAEINCSVTTGSTYQCNSNAYDPDGQIVDQFWIIEGKNIKSSSILYDFSNGGDRQVSLNLTDDLGLVSETSLIITINKPSLIATCFEISPFKIRCDASESVDNENTGVLNYRIYFDEEEMIVGPIAEYEFQTTGQKTIRIEMINGNNKKSEQTYTINIAPKYSAPKPIFFANVELGRVVEFDANDSLLQGRKVSRYEWSYGDGQTEVSTLPKARHIYDQNINFNVTLKITDDSGASATFADQVFVYDPMVLDPGEAGKLDLLGIDSDLNGIRDDVQRWIQSEAKNNTDKKRYMESIALIYEDNFKHLDQLSSVLENYSKKNKYEQCLKLVESNPDNIDELKSLFTVFYVNTNERAKAFLTIESSFAGQITESDMELDTLNTFCQGVGR